MKDVITILEEAADLIERRGLARDHFMRMGSYCVVGAIRMATSGGFRPCNVDQAQRAMRLFLGTDDLFGWNDDPLTTQELVVKSLRACACAADLKGEM